MIQNLFGGDKSAKTTTTTTNSATTSTPQLPRDVKEAVSACRAATQQALQNRMSRMDIEFPVGTKFGVEKVPKQQSKPRRGTSGDSKPTTLDFERSDRELARIFVDMFQPVGGNRIAVSFCNADTADAAKRLWKDDSTATCRVLSMNRRTLAASSAKQRKKVASKGFAAKLALEIDELDTSGDDNELSSLSSGPFTLPDNTEVAIFVAPGPKELVLIERICNQVGMGTLVILLNARLSPETSFGSAAAQQLFISDFERVFCLTAAPQEAAPSCMLHRVYTGKNANAVNNDDWILARKPAVGPPKTILVQGTRPTASECAAALDALQLSAVERNVENAVENIAGWFR